MNAQENENKDMLMNKTETMRIHTMNLETLGLNINTTI